jgi:hypothetical protein
MFDVQVQARALAAAAGLRRVINALVVMVVLLRMTGASRCLLSQV